jgi:NAD(P)-dependent dehydrogenase (short-subunit alcohol dehydrogenase family)
VAVVLITGCSSGFGLAIAQAFAKRGDRVVATARDPSRAKGLLSDPTSVPEVIYRLDVTDQGSINETVRQTLAEYGQIDILVNNAGIGLVGALEIIDEPLLRQVFDTNVFGAAALTRAILPSMRERRSGRVIFMNAIGGILTTAYLGAYCASKPALDCIAAIFDLELRPFGIRVSSVYPSAFHTAMADKLDLASGEGTPYAGPTGAYFRGLSKRIQEGPSDLSPVVNAVIEAATASDPKLRYVVAPHLAEVLTPAVAALDALHDREVALSRQA